MPSFEPIAIVGRACVLPGALSPEQLWTAVAGGRDLLSSAPAGRWRVQADQVTSKPGEDARDRTWSDRGGYVHGFDGVWNPEGFAVPAQSLVGLDPGMLWALHCARAALDDAGDARRGGVERARVGAIYGNLGYPSAEMARYAEAVWTKQARPDARNRFMSGGSAALLRSALGLSAETFCLDTACASSLYAIKLACDRLQTGVLDLALAGAVNCADDLFIHIGFSALKAMSQSGQSRPFHAEADGLVPAEGAGFVALKRLADARAAGDRIYGVIRGVGLSNDGRGRGFLAPSQQGQTRAMRQAYSVSGIDPREVTLLESHATGTTVGDATELRSTAEVFAGAQQVAIGSLKSNLGHLITAAGVAGLIKVTEAMRHGERPQSLHADKQTAVIGETPFRVLQANEAWSSKGPRVAAISAFGFGGNNAHLIVSEDDASISCGAAKPQSPVRLAVVGVGSMVGATEGVAAFAKATLDRQSTKRASTFALAAKGLKFPPSDLQDCYAQQLLVLEAAREAVGDATLPSEKTGVFMGIEPDVDVCRYGLRWRHSSLLQNADTATRLLTSAGVVGAMPNIPANRLNNQFDLGGASVTVNAGSRSPLVALDLAAHALASLELDVALVGAVDLCASDVHEQATADLKQGRAAGGDAAIVFVLKRMRDAEQAGDTILAAIDVGARQGEAAKSFDELFGQCDAAGTLRDMLAHMVIGAKHTVFGDCTLHVAAPITAKPKDHVGPMLRFDAHAPAVVIATHSLKERTMHELVDEMPIAPMLPSVHSVEPMAHSVEPMAHSVEPMAHSVEPMAQLPTMPHDGARRNTDGTLAAMQSTLIEVGNLQRKFLADQTAMFAQFIAVQQSGMQVLAGARGMQGSLVPNVIPASPAKHASASVNVDGYGHVHEHASLPVNVDVDNHPVGVNVNVNVAVPATPVPVAPTNKRGSTFTSAQLLTHSSGRISEIFGDQFLAQDSFTRQVRMPAPPLLLADRVTGLDATPGSMSQTGTIWTESDVHAQRWYLHQGHVPAGILIESGQADLMLISYLGVDFKNRGERIYRLLGCELTFRGGLPKTGDTLAFDIHLDGHAAQGETRLMFFHSDCEVNGVSRLSVRKGQAGFFTDAELKNSEGCLWKPEAQEIVQNPRLAAPAVICTKSAFSKEDVLAFSEGRTWDCFGPGYDWTKTHTRTPRIQNGRMMLLGAVDLFDSEGGAWGRGYLKSTEQITPQHWFFDGHFKNDPCMPGTLMFEGCLQAMAFYMTALGFTCKRDGWRFEPVENEPFQLSCRGQVTPQSQVLTYEVFVEEVIEGDTPVLYADLLCTVDGLKAFHARRVGLKLIPGWPLDEGGPEKGSDKPVAKAGDFAFDLHAMVACANGRPSAAFGPIYDRFDSPVRVARLPSAPYHFLSRVSRTEGVIGSMQKGMQVDVEYDVPADAWYFDENGCRTMPFAVLLEAALQPCGWLASYMGCALTEKEELFFRNLDGTGKLLCDVLPDAGTLLTKVKSKGLSKTGPMIIVSFDVECFLGETRVYEMETVFGFFPAAALQNQIGLATSEAQRALLQAPHNMNVDLSARPPAYWPAQGARLAEPMLLMLDRVVHFDRTGGEKGLGLLRGEKDVDAGEWFFKAHFFQDPVQPGSLGIEAMVALLQFFMLETGMGKGMENARFEALSHSHAMTWKYRGQVIPSNGLISTTLEITEVGRDESGPFAVGKASLWVDGKRIYEATNIGMRIVSTPAGAQRTFTLDPAKDTWLKDHCPTYTQPALPMMSMVDLLAQAASHSEPVIRLEDVRVKGWLAFAGPRTLRTERLGDRVRLLAINESGKEQEVATAKVFTGMYPPRPKAFAPVLGEAQPSPYTSGEMFHGPAFHIVQSLVRTAEGASSIVRASSPIKDGSVPFGRVNPMLLDGATHGVPHDALRLWDSRYPEGKVAFPAWITEIAFYGAAPKDGLVRCEVRPDGCIGTPEFPAFRIQLIGDDGVWCSMRLVEASFAKGAIGLAKPKDRQAFMRDGHYVPTLRVSTQTNGVTALTDADVGSIDWFPGTVVGLFGSRETETIARAEHMASAQHLHPRMLPAALPLTRVELQTKRSEGTVHVTGDAMGKLDLSPVRDFWRRWFARGAWPVEDLYYSLIQRFVRRVVITDPQAFAAVKGKSVLYLANHQVGVESLLFSIIASALSEVPTVTLAKIEHKTTWLGELITHAFRYPGVKDPKVITFFDRDDKASLPAILQDLAAEMTGPGRSVMVHVEGTRSLSSREPVQKMSGAFIDMALAIQAPIVPVRFVGGLPSEPLQTRLEFPIGMGKQDLYIGKPIHPQNLAPMPYGERKKLVMNAINSLGPTHATETPFPGDPAFAARVLAYQKEQGVSHEHATIRCALTEYSVEAQGTQKLLRTASAKTLADGSQEGEWLAELGRRLIGRQ